jgi:predicted phage terminase large subunit-like protein
MNLSNAQRFSKLPKNQRDAFLLSLSQSEAEALYYDWRGFNARPNQIAPEGDWLIWLALAGRGFGKTRMGTEWVREQVKAGKKRIGIVTNTHTDLLNVVLYGESGLLSVCHKNEIKSFKQKPFEVVFTNGAIAQGYCATTPDLLRGIQFDCAWCDELVKWEYPRETWDMLNMCVRLGNNPQIFISTTPSPISLIKDIVAGKEGKVVVTRGSTAENKANLSDKFIENIYAKHAGTRLGRQELEGEILGDVANALWRSDWFDMWRVGHGQSLPKMDRIVVGIDPAVSENESSNEHGIVVVGIKDSDIYILEDATTTGTPQDWAKRAISRYHAYNADAIVVEVNQGGDMCKHTIRSVDESVAVIEVRASRGKHVRAEPVSSLYEQGRVHHAKSFPELEQQLLQFTSSGYAGEDSPDRADALIWAISKLLPEINIDIKNSDVAYKTRSSIC